MSVDLSAVVADVTGVVTWPVAVAAVAVVVAVVMVGVVVRRVSRGADAPTVLTVAVAAVVTVASATGMWRVFGDALGAGLVGRVVGFAVLELALMASAIRARANLRDTGVVGVDGVAVWVIATLSGVASAWDQDGALGKLVRLSLPLLAAWLWERGLAAERRKARARRPVVIAWRWTRERLMVRLGLADPVERATPEVDRARRLARLTRARLRLAVLERSLSPGWVKVITGHPVRVAWARRRLTRLSLAAVEYLDLGQDRRVSDEIRATVAAVVGLPDATDPATLADVTSWAVSRPRRQSPAIVASRVAAGGATVAPPTTAATVPDATGDAALPETTAGDSDTTPAVATGTATGDATAGGVGDTAPVAGVTGPVAGVTGTPVAAMIVADQVAWFARHLRAHPGRSTDELMTLTGLPLRTVQRRVKAATLASEPGDAAAGAGS